MNREKYLVTGATGFVGAALIKRLLKENIGIRAAVLDNKKTAQLSTEVERIIIAPISETSDHSVALQNIDCVIHLAARVHIMQETAHNPLQEFRRVNLHGTERLAIQAAQAGVKRFIFMSTIGVNGNSSGSKPFTEDDKPAPHNSYSVSKLEAEVRLKEISAKTGMEVVIVRAPLVYGPGNPGNFLSLLRVISKGLPLPLASIHNQRSFLYVDNLADALACCTTQPQAAGQTFFVSDGEDISTPKLIRQLAAALDCPVRLLPFPPSLMRFVGKITGKSAAVDRLLGSLVVDSDKISRVLGWKPPLTMKEGLAETAKWFKKVNSSL